MSVLRVNVIEDESADILLKHWCCYVKKCKRQPIKKVRLDTNEVIALCKPHLDAYELDHSSIERHEDDLPEELWDTYDE